MAHYTNSARPSVVRVGDTFDFTVKGRVYQYVVKRDTANGTKWLSRREAHAKNGEILTVLGFSDKPCQEAFAKSAFGHAITKWAGSIPAANRTSKNAMLKLVKAIYRAIDAVGAAAPAPALPKLSDAGQAVVNLLKQGREDGYDDDAIEALALALYKRSTGTDLKPYLG